MVLVSRRRVVALALACFLGNMRTSQAADEPIIAAASDLKFVLTEVADLYTRETGHRLRLSFGSSGNFARQITQGAPFDMFLSADESFILGLAERGLTLGPGDLYAVGRLVVYAPRNSPIKPDPALADLGAAVLDGRLRRLAIANTEHAPYGRAARQALISAGLWDKVQSRLVFGENISQAAQFVVTGNAEAGLIAYSLAVSPELAARGTFALVPEAMHEPLRQRMVLLTRAGDVAKRFYDFVQQPATRAIFVRYGFALPRAGD